jgi:hypothetical protein
MAALGLCCAPRGASVASPSTAAPAACCRDHAEVERLSGERVTITGIYHPVVLQKRPGPLPDHDREGRSATTVSIDTVGGPSIMLEIYYSDRGERPAAERERFSGRRVRVTGTLHARTPPQTDENGGVLQTMIGPYLGEIERIEEAGP